MNWIPRNQRWSQEERKEKESQARKLRAKSRFFWENLYGMRQKIEDEISDKKLARIKLWD
jgi:hypothetical protein